MTEEQREEWIQLLMFSTGRPRQAFATMEDRQLIAFYEERVIQSVED